jgi:hypothetical protein
VAWALRQVISDTVAAPITNAESAASDESEIDGIGEVMKHLLFARLFERR